MQKRKTINIPAGDGYPLAATVYYPASDADAGRLVIICAALAVRQRFYEQFARYLTEQGATTVSFDYRGIGRSLHGTLRGHPARMQDWGVLDTQSVINWACERYPKHGLAVVAHSAGGQVFGLAPDNDAVDRVLGVAAQSGYWGHWPWPHKLLLWTLWHIAIPGLSPLFGYFPGAWFGLGHIPSGVARQWARWGRNPHYIVDPQGVPWRAPFHRFRGQLKLLAPTDDWLAPLPAVTALGSFYANAKVEIEPVSSAGNTSLGHFGFFRTDSGAALWPSQWRWLQGA